MEKLSARKCRGDALRVGAIRIGRHVFTPPTCDRCDHELLLDNSTAILALRCRYPLPVLHRGGHDYCRRWRPQARGRIAKRSRLERMPSLEAAPKRLESRRWR